MKKGLADKIGVVVFCCLIVGLIAGFAFIIKVRSQAPADRCAKLGQAINLETKYVEDVGCLIKEDDQWVTRAKWERK